MASLGAVAGGIDTEYLEAVLDVVAAIPPGRATTYGTVADVVAERLGRGGPRQVGAVLARTGADVPWWRVVNAAGRPAAHLRTRALAALRADGCPLAGDGDDAHVVLRRAIWWPDDDDPAAGVSPASAGS